MLDLNQNTNVSRFRSTLLDLNRPGISLCHKHVLSYDDMIEEVKIYLCEECDLAHKGEWLGHWVGE